MLLSESYRRQNQSLHESRADYGTSGRKWAGIVLQISKQLNSRDILDYGCGKRTMQAELGFDIKNYDPCIPGLEAAPMQADIVCCTDVLEHIEPDCIDAVLADLDRVTRKVGVLTIALQPAKKFLPDGRNAHLLVKPVSWWLPKLCAHFEIEQLNNFGSEVLIVVSNAS